MPPEPHVDVFPGRGLCPLQDIRFLLPQYRPELLVDIGANVGNFAAKFHKLHPDAGIICFEPSPASFEALRNNQLLPTSLRAEAQALGSRAGQATMLVSGTDSTNHILSVHEPVPSGHEKIMVLIDTLDNYTERNQLAAISYLKIDTEGHDLEVIAGSHRLLTAQLVDFVQVEVGCNDSNHFHVPLEAALRDLRRLGYELFGIYELSHEWPTEEPHLRRCDLVFCSRAIINGQQVTWE